MKTNLALLLQLLLIIHLRLCLFYLSIAGEILYCSLPKLSRLALGTSSVCSATGGHDGGGLVWFDVSLDQTH